MNSKLYFGKVSHTRFLPIMHRFEYDTFMCFLDIDELDTVFDSHPFWSYNESNLAWFNPEKYIGRDSDIRTTVTEQIKLHKNKDFDGRICLLTHLTYFGYCFNPVSFYYCYDNNDELEFIVSEITNTPWGQRHVYVTEVNGPQDSTDKPLVEDHFKKIFHVSPFLDMDYQYHWKFNHPEDQLIINMDNHKNDKRWFNAYLELEAKPITKQNLSLALRRYPMMTLKIILAIHWQALKLKLKGAKFYDHPNPESLRTTD